MPKEIKIKKKTELKFLKAQHARISKIQEDYLDFYADLMSGSEISFLALETIPATIKLVQVTLDFLIEELESQMNKR